MHILQNSIDEKINRYWYGLSFNFYLHTMQMIQSSIVDRHIDTEFGNLFVWRGKWRSDDDLTVPSNVGLCRACYAQWVGLSREIVCFSKVWWAKPSVHGFMMRPILKFRIKYARDFFLKTFSLIDEYICIYFYFIYFFLVR